MNENFINIWRSNVELGTAPRTLDFIALRREQGFKPVDKANPLAQAMIKGRKKFSPSDSLIISPGLELMGRQPVNELLGTDMAQRYLTFLKESLEGKLPGLREEVPSNGSNVVLTPQRPEAEILSVLRAAGLGHQDYTVVNIDATAFENGGTLKIAISVGHAEASGSFDLFTADSELPTEGQPQNALDSAYRILPDDKGEIKYSFTRGQVFKLGATGDWSSKKGSVNAFWAKISVETSTEPQPSKMAPAHAGKSAEKVAPAHAGKSAEEVMNAFVKAMKNLDAEGISSLVSGHAKEEFSINTPEDLPEDLRTQMIQVFSHIKILNSEYVGDEFHFRLRMPPGGTPAEALFKMRKVEDTWLIYEAK